MRPALRHLDVFFGKQQRRIREQLQRTSRRKRRIGEGTDGEEILTELSDHDDNLSITVRK